VPTPYTKSVREMKKYFWTIASLTFLLVIGVVVFNYPQYSNVIEGKFAVKQTLQEDGFEDVIILDHKPLTLSSRFARVRGMKFNVEVVKNHQTQKLAVFYKPFDGSVRYLNKETSHIFFE
jgi:hypothetical protein